MSEFKPIEPRNLGHFTDVDVKNNTQHCMCSACKNGVIHSSDCSVHNIPAQPIGNCDCDVFYDLLNACKLINSLDPHKDSTTEWNEAFKKVSAAISKATGETP